jgi:Flp pilus assembly protein TadD
MNNYLKEILMDGNHIYRQNIKILKNRHPKIYDLIHSTKHTYPYPLKKLVNDKSEVNYSVDVPGYPGVLYYNDDDKGIMVNAIETLSSQNLNNNDLLMCIGMGLGYVPLAAVGIFPNKPKIVILEPFVEAFVLAVSSVNLTELLNYENLEIFLGKESSVSQIIKKYGDEFYVGTCRRISHLPYRKIFGDRFITYEKELNEHIDSLYVGWNTVRIYGETLNKNCMENLASLFDGITIDRLKDQFADIPAVVIASGPSLEKDLETINRIRNNALILSCDSAVRPLISKNIIPHMFFAVDHKNINFDKVRFNLQELRKSIFVYWMEASMDNVRGFLGDKRVGVMSGNVFNNVLIQSIFQSSFTLPGAVSSNSDMAILTAIHLGCNPIILAGMDLAFSEGQDHASGSVLRDHDNKNKMILIDGLDGRPVYSLMPMVSGRIVLENNMRRHNREFIDISLNGAFIKGSKIKSLNEVKESILKKEYDFDKIIQRIDWTPAVTTEKAEEPLNKLKSILGQLENDSKNNLVEVCKLKNSGGKYPSKKTTNKIKQSMATLNGFKNKHNKGLAMVENYCFSDQLDVDRSITNLGMDNELTIDILNFRVLEIQKKYYRSIYLAAHKAYKHTKTKSCYFKEINNLKKTLSQKENKAESYLLMARCNAREGMVWLSEKAYCMYLKIHPDSISVISELADLYMSMRLWQQANKLVQDYETICSEGSKLYSIKSKINMCLMEVLKSAKHKMNSEIMDKDQLKQARLEILEFLSVFPENLEAIELMEKIKTYEKDQATAIRTTSGFSDSPEQYTDLEAKAKRFVREGDYERAIGIYEGLIKRVPEREDVFRLMIGDLRFEMGDYKSALWHYKKGKEISPVDEKLMARIRFANSLDKAASFEIHDHPLAVTALMIFDGPFDGLKNKIERMEKNLPSSYEIILIFQSGKDLHEYSELTEILTKNSRIKEPLIEIEAKPVWAVNRAFKNAKGKSILLVDGNCVGNYKYVKVLINRLNKNSRLGLASRLICNEKTATKTGIHGGINHSYSFSMKNGGDSFVGFRRDLFKIIGFLDEGFNNLIDAFEDLKIRAGIAGFQNIIVSDNRMNGYMLNSITGKSPELSKKWAKKNSPPSYEIKQEMVGFCHFAEKLYANGEVDHAINTLVEGIKKYPDCDLFYRYIAQILIREKRPHEAIQALKAIPENDYKNSTGMAWKLENVWDRNTLEAYSLFYNGETTMALKKANEKMSESPNDSKMLNLMGVAAFVQGDYGNARKYFESAIRADRYWGQPWLSLSEIKRIEGDETRAFKLIRRAFMCSPEDRDLANRYYKYGCLEKFSDAVIYQFENTIKYLPGNKQAYYLLIDLLIQSNNYEKAMDLIETCIIAFGKEDGIIEAALSIREYLGLHGSKDRAKEKGAVVEIDSEVDHLGAFLSDLKSRGVRIDFVDKGQCHISKKIAVIFGASIISTGSAAKKYGSYQLKFKHNDVVEWLSNTYRQSTKSMIQ